jgi:hypothetical protein
MDDHDRNVIIAACIDRSLDNCGRGILGTITTLVDKR